MRWLFPLMTIAVACSPPPSRGLELDGFDFGIVASGQLIGGDVTVRNTGSGRVVLAGMEVDDPAFELPDTQGVGIGPGTAEVFRISFGSSSPLRTDHHATLIVRATDGTTAKATVTAVSAFIDCRLDLGEVDFCGAATGFTAHQQLRVTNRSAIPDTVLVGNTGGDDALFFGVPQGEVTLGPGEEHALDFRFTPSTVRDYEARVVVVFGRCPPAPIRLRGTGLGKIVVCSERQQLPLTALGRITESSWTVLNWGPVPVQLSQLAITPNPEFQLGEDAGRIVVPEAHRDTLGIIAPGAERVPVVFAPTLLGDRTGQLSGTTSAPGQPQLACTVSGRAGGPDIEVTPQMLEVPADGGVGHLTVRNTAHPADLNGALRLFGYNYSGPATLSVSVPPQPVPPQGTADLPVSTTGPGNWLVTLSSNDVDEPAVVIVVRAEQ